MTTSSFHAPAENPDALAHRLIQNAHTSDGLPELAAGLSLLILSALSYAQVNTPRALFADVFLIPVLCLAAPLAVRRLRRYNIRNFGYMQPKPLSKKQLLPGLVVAGVMVTALIVVTQSGHTQHGILAGAGVIGGAVAALSGRLRRFVIGGLLTAALGVIIDLAGASLPIGFAILFGFMGLYFLVCGSVAFARFQAR